MLPEITSQWSDIDGDGGDNLSSSNRVDNFPTSFAVNDFDGDGFGDNAVAGSYQPDACPRSPTSTANDEFGCPDANDGVSDDADRVRGT